MFSAESRSELLTHCETYGSHINRMGGTTLHANSTEGGHYKAPSHHVSTVNKNTGCGIGN